jgi:LacI family transcriptional regulator
MILCDTHDRADLQDEYLVAMRAQRVRGFVMIAAVASSGLKEITKLRAPIVFVNRRNPVGSGAFVGIDDRAAGAAAADHFIGSGRRRLAVVSPREGSSASTERVAGFVARLLDLGWPEKAISREQGESLSHLQVGYDAAARLFGAGPMPDAVLCVSDQIAYGIARRAREQGLAIPGDCELVSIDGTPLSRWVAPWLKSIEIPYGVYGAEIVAGLRSIWSGEVAGERLLPIRREALSIGSG